MRDAAAVACAGKSLATTGAWMLPTRQQQNWSKPAHVAPAIGNRPCVGIAPRRASKARQEMNMQCVVTGRDKHLELVETRRSTPTVKTLKLTDTKHEHATSPARPMSRFGACSHKLPHGHWRCGLLTSDVAKSHNHGRPCLLGFWHRRKAVAASGRTQLCCQRHAHQQPALSERIDRGIPASPAQRAHHSLLQMRRGRTRLCAKQPQPHVPGNVTWRPLAGPAGPL